MHKPDKLLRAVAAVCLLALCVCALPAVPVRADEQLDAEIERLQQELNEINSNIASLEGDINASAQAKEYYRQQQQALEELLAMNTESIGETKTMILEKQQEIGRKMQSIHAQQELFEERMVAVYKSRSENALSTLLSVNSFSELLTVSNSLQRITKHDTELIEELSREKLLLEQEQRELEDLMNKLDAQNQEHEAGIEQLAGSIKAQDETINELQAQQAAEEVAASMTEDELEEALAARAAEDALMRELAEQAAEMERQRQAEQEEYERQQREREEREREERERKEQEEREREEREREQNENEEGEGGEGGESGEGNEAGEEGGQDEQNEPPEEPLPPPPNEHNGSVYVWPVPGFSTVTCEFGTPDGTGIGHYGMDIAGAGVSGAAVAAAGGGTVIIAGWHPSYGNYVSIDHGNGVVTLYAHLQGYTVGVGEYVNAGATIGYVGNTGYVVSFGGGGYHLHFEVHVNGVRQDPRSYVSP